MKKFWLLGILVILMLACNALTVPGMGSPPATDLPSPVVPTPTTVAAGLTEQASIDNRPIFAIIARMAAGPFYLLGGTQDGKWLSPDAVVPDLAEDNYQVFSMSGSTGSTRGTEPAYEEFCRSYRVDLDSYPQGGRAVGITGDWDATPRLAQEIPTNSSTYIDELTDWLIGKGFTNPVVDISQILRVDLEGDGTDEVLISASHFVEPTHHSVEPGDYSLVIMRKVVGDSVETIPILGDYYYQEVVTQFPLTYAGAFTADLNGDGILEVLVEVERWESSGIIAFEIDGMTVHQVFEMLCEL